MKSPSWSPLALTKSPARRNENMKNQVHKRSTKEYAKAKVKKPTSVLKQIHPAFVVWPVSDAPRGNNPTREKFSPNVLERSYKI